MSDRELLELAAKAADLMIRQARQSERDAMIDPETAGLWISGVSTWWNPLTDDGDALRLAVKLGLLGAPNHVLDLIAANGDDDPYAATRRAIVRAAAEIGRTMK